MPQKFTFIALITVFTVCSSSALLADLTHCEKVQTNRAVSCSDLKVTLDLRKCGQLKEATLITMKLNCEVPEPFAEAQSGGYRYKLSLNNKNIQEDGSIAEVWMASQRLDRKIASESSKSEELPETKSPPSTLAQTAPSAPTSSEPAASDKEPIIKINGFIDAQYQNNSNSVLSRGFLINDGALYVTSSIQDTDFKIDLPFSMYNNGTVNMTVGAFKAQAYIEQKLSNGLRWKVGQFDTTFGFEGNDTADIVFTRQGSLYNFTDPFIHDGILLGYDFNPELGLNFYVTDPNDRGILTKDKGLQYGLQLVKASIPFRFGPGFLLNPNPITQKTNVYIDVTMGTTIRSVSIDGEFSYNYRSDIINPETNAAMTGIGILLQTLYNFNESTSCGFRAEHVTNQAFTDPKGSSSQSTIKSQYLVFVGPQHYLNKYIRFKLDYSFQADIPYFGLPTVYSHGVQVSSIFRF